MILIGVINLIIGFMSYDEPSEKREKIEFDLPVRDAGADALDAPTGSN